MQVKKILVPTDFSESAANALRHARGYAARFDAELVLIHVVETLAVGYASDLFPVPMAEVVHEMAGQARAELAKLAEGLRAEGLRVRELVTQGKPSAEIVRVAEEESVELIVVGTHGKGVLDHALFGSTTERVMRKAPCPVLSCRLPAHG